VHGIALAGSTLLVTHYGKDGWGHLHRLNPKTLKPVGAPIPVGHHPRAVAWHSVRNVAYVMNWGKESYSLTRCDLATGQASEIPIGFGLIHVAVDPVADKIYTADWAHKRLFVIEAADPSQRHTVELPAPPVRLAVAADGDVMAALCLKSNEAPVDALAVVRPDGSVTTASMTPAHLQPNAVDIGADGMVYVGSLGGGPVHPLAGVHDPETAEHLGSVPTVRGVRALAAHPHLPRAWMATDDGAQMADFANPSNPQVLDVIPTGRNPYGIAVDDGAVYVGDNLDGTVSLLEPDVSDVPLEAVSALLSAAGHQGPLGRALRSYQTFHELPVTGRPDATTVGHLTAPGCATKDGVLQHFKTYDGGHYRYTNIAYYLGDLHMPVGHPDFTFQLKVDLLEKAFDEWNKILSENWVRALEFTRVFDPEQADLHISVGDAPDFHNDGGFRTIYAVTVFPGDLNPWKDAPTKLPIIFNEAIPWSAHGYLDPLPTSIGVDFLYTATHEIGHALGLDHGRKKSVMARNASWYRIPKGDDIDGLRSLYGRFPFTSAVGLEALPGLNHVAYQDCERHLMVIHSSGDGWEDTRLTEVTGARRMAKGWGVAPFQTPHGNPSYVYRGDDDHIHQLWWTDPTWNWADLAAESGGAPPSAGAPYAYRVGDMQRVVYAASEQRVVRLSQSGDQPWQWEDVTPPGAGHPDGAVIAYRDETSGFDVIAYRDNEEHLRILQEGPTGWTQTSLTWATQHENPTLLANNAVWGMAAPGEEHRLFCIDHRQDIRMFYFSADGAWHTRDLTAEQGLPVAKSLAVHRVPVAGELTWTLVFSDYEGHVWTMRSSGKDWIADHIVADGMAPPGRHNVSAWLSQTERHVSYTGENGNLYLLSRPLDPEGDWTSVNLTRRSGAI